MMIIAGPGHLPTAATRPGRSPSQPSPTFWGRRVPRRPSNASAASLGGELYTLLPVGIFRLVLGFIAVAAIIIWIVAAANGFNGAYCFNSSGACNFSSDVTIQWSTVLWLAPVVAVVALGLLFVTRRPR